MGLVHQGDPTHERAWSGIPAGLAAGLREAGCEVIPIDASSAFVSRLASALRMSWLDELTNPVLVAASSAIASRALRRAGKLDGIVMIGSGYRLPSRAPLVTLEDVTVAQVLREPGVAAGISPRAAARWRRRQEAIYEQSRGCCMASRWAAASVEADYGVAADKVHVVGFGSNVAVSAPPRDWSVPRFLFIGVDWERKRGAMVVESFAAVRRRHPEATLDLVGGHPDVDAPGVVGHGPLPLGSAAGQRALATLLEAATCFVMPSAIEPFGIAYLDAARAGVPSIGTTVGGAPDAIGDAGRLVDPSDRRALEEAMLELAEPELARGLGERALARSREYTWAAVAGRVLDVLLPAAPAAA